MWAAGAEGCLLNVIACVSVRIGVCFTHGRSEASQTATVRHRQTLCGPTGYDLHLRGGTERKRRTRGEGKKRAGQRGNEKAADAPVCLLWTALLLACVEFWQAAPAAWIRQPALPWPGEEGRQAMPGEGGRGQGAGGRGPGLTEGYKYHQSPVINRVTVRNLAELWRDTWKYPPQTQAPPTTLLHRPLWWWCWWY